MEKRLWLEAKGAVRRLGEIPLREGFPSLKCVIKVPDSDYEYDYYYHMVGRPDLLLNINDNGLYVLERTVGFETNLIANLNR